MVVSNGTVGVWNSTQIRLFKVQETAAEGPSLAAPKGAVDAVGTNLVNRIGNLNLRGVSGSQQQSLGQGQGQGQSGQQQQQQGQQNGRSGGLGRVASREV